MPKNTYPHKTIAVIKTALKTPNTQKQKNGDLERGRCSS